MSSQRPSRPVPVMADGWGSVRLLAMRALVLMILIGAWSNSHADADSHTTGATSPVALVHAPADVDSGHDQASTAAGEVSSDTSGMWGCLIGVACTLLVLTVAHTHRLAARNARSLTARPARAPTTIPAPTRAPARHRH